MITYYRTTCTTSFNMEINLVKSEVQGCSGYSSIFHYTFEPSKVTEILDKDSEINEVLQRRQFCQRRVDMFKFLQKCVRKSMNSKVSSELIMIPKPSFGVYPMVLSSKLLPECNTITDNDIIVMYCGQSHCGINTENILYLQEIICATGNVCEVVVQEDVSRVKLVIQQKPNPKVLENKIIELQHKVTQLEQAKTDLENKVFQVCVNNSDLEDIIRQLTQQEICSNETQFFNIDDINTITTDPFIMNKTHTTHIELHEIQHSQNNRNLAAEAALKREKQFLQSAYGRRITNIMKNK